jgi:hypothetical protein
MSRSLAYQNIFTAGKDLSARMYIVACEQMCFPETDIYIYIPTRLSWPDLLGFI